MSPASPSLPSSDSHLKWRKRKRESNLKRQQKGRDDEEDDEDDEAAAAGDEDAEEDEREQFAAKRSANNAVDLQQSEVLFDGGQRICDFPAVYRRTVNRPHPSVVLVVAAERHQVSGFSASSDATNIPFLENISHGQQQSLSMVLPDHPTLQPPDVDKPSAYVCTPPALMEGKGVLKRFGNNQLLVPMHSDWFSPNTVHRLERQVIPHFFSGKSAEHTPEKYRVLRNNIIARYMENPSRRLSFADCQGLVAGNELYDLSRIVRFLDHWGIINYLSTSSVHRGLRMAGSLLKEDANGELSLQTGPLRSIDSLILFDRPKCSLKLDDISFLSNSSSSTDSAARLGDLDVRIRESLCEHSCGYCSRPLPSLLYQSQKEAETILCTDCFNDAKFITGHSSLDFVRMDSKKDLMDSDVDSWTDQETLLLLEAIEKFKDNWNEIAEHVGTKSKAQCILHFIRLPMEDGLLENIEVPRVDVPAVSLELQNKGLSNPNSKGNSANSELISGDQLPFASSANPVMSMVAFLASAIGPRVAAACASAALTVLTKEDPRLSSENMHVEDGNQGTTHPNSSHTKDGSIEDHAANARKDTSPLLSEHVRYAAECGLSAAATKAKLFADQEEREVQRLAANIINHQLKRLELKLKQFAEVETLLLKECEQVERTRQRLSAERGRMLSARHAPPGPVIPATLGVTSANALTSSTGGVVNPRPSATPATSGQPNLSPAFANNIPHQHMQYMQRQQMFAFGPRLPLSAIHPSSSGSPQNMVLNSSMPNTGTHHPLLRSSSGNKSAMG